MTASLNPTIRLLGCCARAASILVVSSAPLCFAQQSVATLGVPSATRVSTEQAFEVAKASKPSETNEPTTQIGRYDLPPVRLNAYVQPEIDSARVNVDEMLRPGVADESRLPWQSSQTPTVSPNVLPSGTDASAKTEIALIGTPGMFLSAFAQPKSAEPVLPKSAPSTAVIPTMRQTPAQPQLSPSKWVHQPLVAGHVQRPKNIAPIDRETSVASVQQSDSPSSIDRMRPQSELHRAAMRQRASRTEETLVVPNQTQPIQPGYSITALRTSAMELISEAQLKLDRRAFLTAGDKAIAALEMIAQSIDTREQSATATRDLIVALTAIREAEDFVGKFGMVDGETITRMVRSHSTEILKPYNTSNLSGLAAADVYLDWSRRCLTPLATADPLGSQAIRILAHSHRLRDDGTPFGIATAVHLMRAAADGAPDNDQVLSDYQATLQIAGLNNRPQIAQVQSTTAGEISGQMTSLRPEGSVPATLASARFGGTFPGQQKREVEILEVSPEQFASISPAMAGPPGTANPQLMPMGPQQSVHSTPQNSQQSGTYRPEHVNEATQNQAAPYAAAPYAAAPYQAAPYQAALYQGNPSQTPDSSVKSRVSRAFDPITRLLR